MVLHKCNRQSRKHIISKNIVRINSYVMYFPQKSFCVRLFFVKQLVHFRDLWYDSRSICLSDTCRPREYGLRVIRNCPHFSLNFVPILSVVLTKEAALNISRRIPSGQNRNSVVAKQAFLTCQEYFEKCQTLCAILYEEMNVMPDIAETQEKKFRILSSVEFSDLKRKGDHRLWVSYLYLIYPYINVWD